MRYLLFAALLLCLSAPLSAAGDVTRLDLVLFDGGKAVAGVTLQVGGKAVAATNANGALSVELPAGEQQLALIRNGEQIGELVLEVDAGQPVQVIASLPEVAGGQMTFDVEGAGRRAEDAAGSADLSIAGSVAGVVVSTEGGEPVPGAQIYFSGVDTRASTNADGHFTARLPAGDYRISVVHPDYSTQTREGVTVTQDQQTDVEIDLTPAGLLLSEYMVSAPHIEGSVAEVFTRQREGSGVVEVLGAEQMSRAGDSDAADALKRVTGLTIIDGKYVVIRGQPPRYTLSLWNGSPLPSPDPIRLIVPLDMFPTGVLSSINVEKSYDVEILGSFGGGLIQLETAGVPEENFLELSAKIGGNTLSTGQDGLTYQGGSLDFLGIDDGARAMPPGLDPDATQAELTEAARGFSDTWAIDNETIVPDIGLGIAGGSSYTGLGGELGFRASLNWSRTFEYWEIVERDYAVSGDGSLVVQNDQTETRTDMDVDLGGLLVLAGEWDRHALRSNTFMIVKTTDRASISEGTRVVSQDLFIRDYLLEWNQRELFTEQLIGEHDFSWFLFDWRAMFARTERSSPDRRDYIYRRQSNGEFVFFEQNRAGRRFDDSEDDINSFDADLTFPVLDSERWKLDLQSGFSTYTQDRNSQTRRFSFQTLGNADLTAPPDVLLDPANLGTTLAVSDQTQTNDSYTGEAKVDGIYLKFDLDWANTIRLTAGVRQEHADYEVRTFVAGGSQGGQEVAGNFDETDLLPSVALTWRFLSDMQLRLSGSQTVSRPVLNELSPARYFDPETGEEYLGNPDLLPAKIGSLDARWEWYPSPREALTLGVFTKDYTDPIEQSFVGVGGSQFLRQVQNAAGATVSGVEASARADMTRVLSPVGWEAEWMNQTYVQANAAVMDSEVELARQDLATSAVRPLQGQANYIFNLQLGYDGRRHDANLLLNLVGERLVLAGVEGLPDVYQQPVSQLDVNYTYHLTRQGKLKFYLENLLDPEVEFTQGGQVFRSYKKGVDFGVGLSWLF